jgi:sugar lactone lactonase YvrE
MTEMTQLRRLVCILVCLGMTAGPAVVRADDYGAARRELVDAYQASDFAAMRVAARKALVARPGYPGALFNLALAQALDEDPSAALETLQDLLSVGVDFGAADVEEFAALKDLLEWAAYADAVEKLYEPVGFSEVVATLSTHDFIPEGIAADADGRLYLGSIRHGQLVRLGDSPKILSTPANGHWSVFGMRFDGDGGLWFASAAVPQFLGAVETNGRSGVFRYDTVEGTISNRAVLPISDEAQVLGDLAIAPDGLIYTADSLTGVLYRFNPGNASFERLVDRGVFGSPQGLVLDASGRFLYVADYIGGLYRVTRADGKVEKVRIQANVTDYGIDGLYRYGAELVVIQNGIQPNRVAALTLGEDGLSITAGRTIAANLPEFDEPTLGFVSDDDFYFVANSHWNRFDADNKLPEKLAGPIVLRVSLLPVQ